MQYKRIKNVPIATPREIRKRFQLSFRRWIMGESGGGTIAPYVGADIDTARQHIQRMFIDNMNWNNYSSVWVIDHIVPIRLFDMYDQSDLVLCWNYKNIMPLLKEDNLYKEGEVNFSYKLLELLPPCKIVLGLKAKLLSEVTRLDKYLDKVSDTSITAQ